MRDITVAQAAPSVPSPKPKIMIGSMAAVMQPPISVTSMARRASPTARNRPENPMPIASNRLEGMQISKKR